jgi:hypothetical protein
MPKRTVLIISPAEPKYLSPVEYGERTIVAGPFWSDVSIDGQNVSLGTHGGEFDSKVISSKLKDIKLDLVVVVYTAFRTVEPRRLDKFDCPKVFIAGDTQHGTRPLQTTLRYLHSEKFDYHLTAHCPQHSHWWASTATARPAWLPGYDVKHFPQRFRESGERDSRGIFVGQVGIWHPRRDGTLTNLRNSGHNIRRATVPAQYAARLYARSLYSVNMHLNGGLNARVFEVLSAGGCLVSDRQERQSGMQALFAEGEDYIGYDSDDELAACADWVTRHPQNAVEIARHGNAKFAARHLPETRIREFWGHITHQSSKLFENLYFDSRVQLAVNNNRVSIDILVERMRIYEFLQEQVRVRTGVRVFYSSSVEPLTVADSADLSRLHRAYACSPSVAPAAWDGLRSLGVADQVEPTRIEAMADSVWDLIVIGTDEFLEPQVINLLTRVSSGRIAVAGNGEPIPPSRRILLVQLGWLPDPEWPSLHVRTSVAGVADVSVVETPSNESAKGSHSNADSRLSDDSPEPIIEATPESGAPRNPLVSAHATVVGFDWEEVSSHLPESMNALIATGIIRSLAESRPVDGSGRPIPGYVHAATDFVEPHLRPEWRAHIWGNGADLIWWSSKVASVTAVVTKGAYDPAYVGSGSRSIRDIRIVDARDATYSDVSEAPGPVDIAVVGGEVPDRCVMSLLERISESGLVLVENSDRSACAEALSLMRGAGWRRIDFWGVLPQYLFRGCTTVFYKDDRYVSPNWTPNQFQSTLGPSFAQLTAQ